ncbi:MAG: hypothetical protein WCF41_21920, partial [Pseudolabrys sp.]
GVLLAKMTSGESVKFRCSFAKVGGLPSVLNLQIAPVGPAQLLQFLKERRDACLPFRIVFGKRHEHADTPSPLALLCLSHERPRCRSAAKKRDELAPLHVRS